MVNRKRWDNGSEGVTGRSLYNGSHSNVKTTDHYPNVSGSLLASGAVVDLFLFYQSVFNNIFSWYSVIHKRPRWNTLKIEFPTVIKI